MNLMDILPVLLAATVQYSTPLLFATLGEMITERAGIINLGMEGIMIVSAFCAFLTALWTGSPVLALLFGVLAGGIFSLLHGVMCLLLSANQTVSGLALTILGTGLAGYFGAPFTGVVIPGFSKLSIPLLCDIPLLGFVFFQQDILVYLSFFLVPVAWFFFYRTRAGLSLRAVGEHPAAAIAAGVSASRVRWLSIGVGGLLAGLGGAYLALVYSHQWSSGITEGRGWIAVALVIFAFWKPQRAIYGAYLFGGIGALQMRLQALELSLSSSLMALLPYLFTVLALVWASLWGKGKNGPAALGDDIVRGE